MHLAEPGRWRWGETQAQDPAMCYSTHGVCYCQPAVLEYSPLLLSVATTNLSELYCHTTDYMKIGTGKLQGLLLIISSAFLRI